MEVEEECIPWEVEYNVEYSFSIEGIIEACKNENQDSLCKQLACTVEMTFHHRVMNVALSQPINAELVHANNQFNATNVCTNSANGGSGLSQGGADSCCREYALGAYNDFSCMSLVFVTGN